MALGKCPWLKRRWHAISPLRLHSPLRLCPPNPVEIHYLWLARLTWQQVRLVHAFTLWPSFRCTKLTCSGTWMKTRGSGLSLQPTKETIPRSQGLLPRSSPSHQPLAPCTESNRRRVLLLKSPISKLRGQDSILALSLPSRRRI